MPQYETLICPQGQENLPIFTGKPLSMNLLMSFGRKGMVIGPAA
jgi:hypothetical protein